MNTLALCHKSQPSSFCLGKVIRHTKIFTSESLYRTRIQYFCTFNVHFLFSEQTLVVRGGLDSSLSLLHTAMVRDHSYYPTSQVP